MKKVLTFIAFAAAMNVSAVKAYPPPQLLDDSASFRIAKSVKLGYGDASAPSLNKGTKKAEFNTCSTDDQCRTTQECVNGNCKELCSPSPCSGKTPDCDAEDHAYTCKCTENSCGAGNECVNGRCETCTVGSKCNCDGEKVWGANGSCVCPDGTVDDGTGGCKFECEFSSESACKSGTANCSNCALSGGCYVCSACGTGYELSGTSCQPKACPTGYSTDTTSCDSGYTLQTSGYSADKACGLCVKNACSDSDCEDWQACNADGQCVPACMIEQKICPDSAPDTVASNHACLCACNDTSCPSGYHCSDRSLPGIRTCVPDV